MVVGAAGLGPRARLVAIVGAGLAVAVLAAGALLTVVRDDGKPGVSSSPSTTTVPTDEPSTGTVTSGSAAPAGADDLTADDASTAAGVSVFFGHQSVGWNLVDALPGVYAEHGVSAPDVIEGRRTTGDGGYLLHTEVGQNTDPQSKIDEFAELIRGGIGEDIDVAMVKFCYVDFDAGTDPDAVFAAYRDTLDALQQEYPEVVFLHVTAPLMTGDNPLAENLVRQRYNDLIRSAYPPTRIFDLAAVESTAPDGTKVSGKSGATTVEILHDGYSEDGGHLNAAGAAQVDAALIATIARAAG